MSNIPISVLDSRNEFRPGRSGGSVNWALLVAGIIMLLFGIGCVVHPNDALAGFATLAGVGFLIAGGIMMVLYLRARGTMFAQSGFSLFNAAAVLLFGMVLCSHPLFGATMVAWLIGLGLIPFGLVQVYIGRQLTLNGGVMFYTCVVIGIMEIVLGALMCIWPGSVALFIGLASMAWGVSLVMYSLPVGVDHTNRLW